MTPTREEFLVRFRVALLETPARPLMELRARLPSLADLAELVRLAAAAGEDFWGYFGTAAGEEQVSRAMAALREDAWQVLRGDLRELAASVCTALRA